MTAAIHGPLRDSAGNFRTLHNEEDTACAF